MTEPPEVITGKIKHNLYECARTENTYRLKQRVRVTPEFVFSVHTETVFGCDITFEYTFKFTILYCVKYISRTRHISSTIERCIFPFPRDSHPHITSHISGHDRSESSIRSCETANSRIYIFFFFF